MKERGKYGPRAPEGGLARQGRPRKINRCNIITKQKILTQIKYEPPYLTRSYIAHDPLLAKRVIHGMSPGHSNTPMLVAEKRIEGPARKRGVLPTVGL